MTTTHFLFALLPLFLSFFSVAVGQFYGGPMYYGGGGYPPMAYGPGGYGGYGGGYYGGYGGYGPMGYGSSYGYYGK